MISTIKFWFECSRWYTLPMSFFSWLVIFTYSSKHDGNILYGVIALIGICFAHLATNLFDDYCDYHYLTKLNTKGSITLPNTQRGKCRYILNGNAKLSDVLKIVTLYCTIALSIGIFFCYTVGIKTLIFIVMGGLIVLSYSVLSNHRLSEFAVGTAFGPILFGGVYYIMTKQINYIPIILSVPILIFTVNLLFTDTFLDMDIDKKEGKKTFAGLLNDKALTFQILLITTGYLTILILPALGITDFKVLTIYITILLSIDLIKSLKLYSTDKNKLPQKKWYHFPFEDWDDIKENRSESFMFRMYQARNLMIYVSILLSLSLL